MDFIDIVFCLLTLQHLAELLTPDLSPLQYMVRRRVAVLEGSLESLLIPGKVGAQIKIQIEMEIGIGI